MLMLLRFEVYYRTRRPLVHVYREPFPFYDTRGGVTGGVQDGEGETGRQERKDGGKERSAEVNSRECYVRRLFWHSLAVVRHFRPC